MTEEKQKIFTLIDELSKEVEIPENLLSEAKEKYMQDPRSYEEIEKEILTFSKKVHFAEAIVNQPISEDVLEQSILLIGPIGTGKSTISKLLKEQTNLPTISLDNDSQLSSLYQKRNEFQNFKDFEFWLTSTILTNMKTPCIVDFGGGHSVYENPILFHEMKKLVGRFQNVELILPCEDIKESEEILTERLKNSREVSEQMLKTNHHFLTSPCNYQLASHIIYTKGKSLEEVGTEILNSMNTEKERTL